MDLKNEYKIIDFPCIKDPRGDLTFLEENNHIPFKIKRTYWIYDVPGGEERYGHAYKTLHEVIICLSGSFDVKVDDGNNKKGFSLNRSYYGLYIPNLTWRELSNFSTNSLCLIIASEEYNELDYIRNYKEYLAFIKKK